MFSIAHVTWPQLAADRAAWRTTLRQGFPPKPFRSVRAAAAAAHCAHATAARTSTTAANYTAADYNPSTVYYNHY